MSLDGIIRAIRDETDRQVRQIEADAAAEVSAIGSEAADAARRAEDEAVTARDPTIDREVARIVDRARLDAHRAEMWAVETTYQEALADVRRRLAALRGSEQYPTVLAAFLDEGLRVIGDGVTVSVDPADVVLVRRLLSGRQGRAVDVVGSTPCIGGLQLATSDGRRVLNTLESRLERADGRLRALVAALLPGGASP